MNKCTESGWLFACALLLKVASIRFFRCACVGKFRISFFMESAFSTYYYSDAYIRDTTNTAICKCILDTKAHLPQPFSSEPSRQSICLSHRFSIPIQYPSLMQLNSCRPHCSPKSNVIFTKTWEN